MTTCCQCNQSASWSYTQHGEGYSITRYYCKDHSPKTKSSSGISYEQFNRMRENQEKPFTRSSSYAHRTRDDVIPIKDKYLKK